jgi:predicted nuclease of predicted toxin-antitoxin system
VSSIFVELYLDEDVDVLVADLLKAKGFVAVTARDAGLLHKDDYVQLEYAISQRKALLTHNRADFENLAQEHFITGKLHYGIILAVRHSPYEIARRLLIILNQVTADEMKDQLRYI